MKKIFLLSAAAMVLAIAGCKKEDPTPEPTGGDPIYTLATDDQTVYELTQGKQKTVNFYAKTTGGVVSSMLYATVAVDESKVAKYNQTADTAAVMLPSTAYEISGTSLKIYTNNKKSLSESVQIKALYEMKDTIYVLPLTITKIEGSDQAKLVEDPTIYIVLKKRYTKIDKGEGTKEKPYLIYDAQDLWDMHENLRHQDGDTTVCTWYKMMQDVDMKMDPADTLNWVPLNWEDPFDGKVNFDGNGKKISNFVSKDNKYSSFFGVLYGYAHDVTFVNSYVQGSPAIGTVGGYVGTNSKSYRSKLYKVHVVNGTIQANHTANGAGGICGRLFGTIDACSFDGKIIDGKYTGGIVGFDDGKVKDATLRQDIAYLKSHASHITNCSVSGTIVIPNGGQRTGGILGDMCCDYTEIRNCFVSAGISGNMCAAGIAAHANWDNGAEQHPYNTISKCIVWCDSLTARMQLINNYSCGAVAGFCAPDNTCEDCWYRDGLTFVSNDAAATSYFAFIDQPNSGQGNPQTVGVECDYSTRYKLPYNGKKAAAGKTASAIARELGWDETIWDLSGNVPVLK